MFYDMFNMIQGLLLLLQLLQYLPRASGNCAQYGCTSSLSFTCPTYFYEGSFYPELAASYEDADWKPTGAGCVANDGKVLCPFANLHSAKNLLMSWDITSQYAVWNLSMPALVTLPVVGYYGDTYVVDGSELCGFDSSEKPFGPCIVMEPVTGPLFDLTVVSEKFLYLLYKCGFMVAYFVSDGTAYASIWLNTTLDGVNGTFVPLANPAVSGERLYIIAGFKPFQPTEAANTEAKLVQLRLYAIDIRTIMVERIKVAWYHDVTLSDADLPYLRSPQAACSGQSDPMDLDVAHVLVDQGVVVAAINYVREASTRCGDVECSHAETSATNSFLISATDLGETYKLNSMKETFPPLQAMVYASPNFTASGMCDHTAPPPAPAVWVSWMPNATNSAIESIDAKSFAVVTKLGLDNILVTSKMVIFYRNQVTECSNNTSRDLSVLMPLVFGYTSSSDGQSYITAVDVATSPPDQRWSVKTFRNDRVVGQIVTVGSGRDTMMALTTVGGSYFYVLYSDDV